jgi:hypothetical protein
MNRTTNQAISIPLTEIKRWIAAAKKPYTTTSLFFGLAALALLGSDAKASSITSLVAAYGSCSDPSNVGCVALPSYLTGQNAGQTIQTISFSNATNGGFTSGIATYTGNVGVNQGSQPVGEAAGTTYIGVGQYSTNPGFQPQYQQFVTVITFSNPLTYFGLYWGSPSSLDTLLIYNGSSQLLSYSGSNLSTASYVSFNAAAGTTFNAVALVSAQCCFENNNESYVTAAVPATPEPGTMTLSGGAIVALPLYFYRRRRRQAGSQPLS